MSNDEPFVDLYGILKVHPECDTKALELAYRHLAKLYHPDHPETADIDSFTIEGVDQVISTSRTTAAERLRITQSPDG